MPPRRRPPFRRSDAAQPIVSAESTRHEYTGQGRRRRGSVEARRQRCRRLQSIGEHAAFTPGGHVPGYRCAAIPGSSVPFRLAPPRNYAPHLKAQPTNCNAWVLSRRLASHDSGRQPTESRSIKVCVVPPTSSSQNVQPDSFLSNSRRPTYCARAQCPCQRPAAPLRLFCFGLQGRPTREADLIGAESVKEYRGTSV